MDSVLCPKCDKSNDEFRSRCTECGAALPYASEAISANSQADEREDGPEAEQGVNVTETVASQEADALVGRSISHYQVLQRLGAGGMGVVYRATDTSLRRTVALKFLSPKLSRSPLAKARLIREARAASALDDSNIGTVHEVGEHEGRLFIAMAFYEGQTLQERLQSSGRLSVPEAESILSQLASALSAAHGAGIVHRDLKPANVMLIERRASSGERQASNMEIHSRRSARRSPLVKLLDFGLAKLLAECNEAERSLTELGEMLGTVAYMSPEQARGAAVDHRSDLWSLGVVAYEMLAGVSPYQAESKLATLARILYEEPRPLLELRDDVPLALEFLIQKLLRKEPARRLQNAEEAIEALESSGGPGQSARPGIDPKPTRARAPKRLTVRRALFVGLAIGIAAAGLALSRFAPHKAIDSLVVLPLVNASKNPDSEYLGVGLTESLINSLGQLPDLRVMSREAAFRFKGKETDVEDAAQALNVRAVLTGRLTQHEDRVVVSLELIDARDLSHVWGARYDRKMAELVSVQSEMAQAVASTLRPTLTGEEQRRLSKRLTENPEAHQAYLRGLYVWRTDEDDDWPKGGEFFQKAIDLDPSFAAAHALLAMYYGISAGRGYLPPDEAWPKAEAATRRALELDETLPEAHRSLAAQKMYLYRDWPGAEREIQRAIQLNPSFPDGHHIYAQYLCFQGRFDEAILENRRSQELDPTSSRYIGRLGLIYAAENQYDRAIEQFRMTIELGNPYHEVLGDTYALKGMEKEAVSEWRKAMLHSGDTELATLLERVYAEAGFGEALLAITRKRLERLQDRQKRGEFVPASALVWCYLRLGDKDQVFAWLDKAAEEHNILAYEVRADPQFDSLRSDPRYAKLMRRLGLPS